LELRGLDEVLRIAKEGFLVPSEIQVDGIGCEPMTFDIVTQWVKVVTA
jgi:hypothetical protein